MRPSSQLRPVLRGLASAHPMMAGTFWVIVFAVFAVLECLLVTLGDVQHGIWQFSAVTVAKYVPLALCLLLVPVWLRIFVANGVTRKDFCRAALVFAALYIVPFALMLTVGNLVEYLVFSARDLPTSPAAPHLYQSTGQPLLAFFEYFLVLAAYAASGLLIGAGYARFGGWGGTGFVLVALLPIVITECVLPSGWELAAVRGTWLGDLPPVLCAGLSLVTTVLAGAAFAPMVSRTAIGAAQIQR